MTMTMDCSRPDNETSFRPECAAIGEERTLGLLRNRDMAASEAFVRRHGSMAISVARRILRSEADANEAVQDAFMSFFHSLHSFGGDARLTTWFHRIVINAALMKRRARHRRPECSMHELLPRFQSDGSRVGVRPAWSISVDEIVAREESRALVRRKIDELPEDYRNVILLRDIEQLDTDETAQLLGDTVGAVKTRLHRARMALRTLLEKELV